MLHRQCGCHYHFKECQDRPGGTATTYIRRHRLTVTENEDDRGEDNRGRHKALQLVGSYPEEPGARVTVQFSYHGRITGGSRKTTATTATEGEGETLFGVAGGSI